MIAKKKTTQEKGVKATLNADQFKAITSHLALSQNKSMKLAIKDLRVATRNRKFIEDNLKQKMNSQTHKLDKFFQQTSLDLVKKSNNGKEEPTSVVFCHDLEGLVDLIINERGTSENFEIKIGIDGGGSFLKVCLNIVEFDEAPKRKHKRGKFKDGVGASMFKSTSVNKLIIIAIAKDVEETYQNMLKVWNLLKLSDFCSGKKVRFATDLKMSNILLGLMSHASNHPCSWCDIHR